MSTTALAYHASATYSSDISDWIPPYSSDVWDPSDMETIYHSFSLPRCLSPVPTQSREMFTFTISRYERLIEASYFQPAYDQLIRVRQSLSWRSQVSPVARWTMFLAAKVFESLVDSPQLRAAKFIKYYDWSKRFEGEMVSLPLHGLTSAELQNRLSERLEVALFKLRTTDSINTYQLLRNHASVFHQIVSSDPAFWSDTYCRPTRVSLAHVLALPRYEIAHFALLDMMCSMAYGLPQVIDYDTSTPPLETNFYPVEWIHGCPVDFQIIIAKINSLCNWDQIGPPPDWRPLERELRDWQPDVFKVTEEESWKAVARLAVRESWRHALLIYMYMAVCGVASDDPRVSSSVKQVFQIICTVKHQPQPVTNLHFSTQYLVAGAYTPNEKQRAIAREQLSVSVKFGSWLLNGSDLLPVLDHLWHGAAANGRPIRWRDYVHSRQVALPIPI
ncbi:hypothetical protein FRC12_000387 [Ceratobasidium sp. 428]|nr:hypothetical protein FRC12_000387 [Ceratobasidium sp. 428]